MQKCWNPFPILRDLDSEIYIKGDSGKLVIGGFESNAKPWDPAGVNADTPYLMFDEDWDHIAPMIESAIVRIPKLQDAGISHFMNGPESFTPDTGQLMGKVPDYENYFVAAGFNSIGIMSSAGVGRTMALWIKENRAPLDLWDVDIQRFEPVATTDHFLADRLAESVHSQFDMHWPYKQKNSGRDLIRSPMHEQFEALGAVFGVSGAWERPFWFADNAQEKTIRYSYAAQHWWPIAKREAQTLENHVGLIELTPFCKLTLSGKDALAFLQKSCTNNVDISVGKVIYTTMLNEQGGIESEHTVTRLDQDRFFLVSGAASRVKDVSRITQLASGYQLKIVDDTFNLSVLGVMGAKSRALLQSLTGEDLSAEKFGFAQSKQITLDDIPIQATRISFVGELGYELYMPNHQAVDVLNRLLRNGADYNLGCVGHYCVEGCRLEKGYLHWGHDMGCEDSPLQLGLEFSVCFEKEFTGKQALLKQKQNGLQAHLLQFVVESDSTPLLLHDEPIYSQDRIVGRTTSGGLGFRTGMSICNGYIDYGQPCTRSQLLQNSYRIKVAGQYYDMQAIESPVYDPGNKRLKG